MLVSVSYDIVVKDVSTCIQTDRIDVNGDAVINSMGIKRCGRSLLYQVIACTPVRVIVTFNGTCTQSVYVIQLLLLCLRLLADHFGMVQQSWLVFVSNLTVNELSSTAVRLLH